MYNVPMVKYQTIIFAILIIFFLLFSFAPTFFELSLKDKLADPNREFILEHNYYWPDFNLYLSKVRQAWEGRLFPVEKYTSEPHKGSLVQIFYVGLGWLGRVIRANPNTSYQLGRILFAPLLLILIARLTWLYFPSFGARIMAFIVVIVSGSFPKIYTVPTGGVHIESFMQWWSTIDNLQRITFIPHILFGQLVSLFLLNQLMIRVSKSIKIKHLILYSIMGNIVGIVFPPSLMTLFGVIGITMVVQIIKKHALWHVGLLFIIFTCPSLLYFFVITHQIPWVALVETHRRHFMPVPLDQYFLGTGPVFVLAAGGALTTLSQRAYKWYPLIYWALSSWLLAAYFSLVRDQSPLRFTQTGVFIPLGLLASYFFYQLWIRLSNPFVKGVYSVILIFYVIENIYMMVVSYRWQESFIIQRVGASIPPVPYPPQTIYPLTSWMDGIRFLRDHTNHNDVVIAGLTAGNFIPAYAGNFVYFGQSNTVSYEEKYQHLEDFFRARLSPSSAQRLLNEARVKYVFYSFQEKELSGLEDISVNYPFLKPVYQTTAVTIYQVIG